MVSTAPDHTMSNELIAITYTEFDNIVGTQLKYSYPPGAISKEVFELFSDYVIVAKQLCQRFIVVALEDVIFLNYPISIDNPKYYRNNLAFSFGLVLPRNVDCDPFETVLKKLSSSFANLEVRESVYDAARCIVNKHASYKLLSAAYLTN